MDRFMRGFSKALIVIGVTMIVLGLFEGFVELAFSQVKVPQLKAEVHLDLIRQQNAIYRTVLQMKDLEAQYIAKRGELSNLQSKLAEDTKTAIERSGLDKEKYEINADTFDVTVKPVVQEKK